MRTFSTLPALLLVAVSLVEGSPVVAAEGDRDVRESVMAEQAIFLALVASSSGEGRRACETSQFACGDDRADLGLALLGNKDTPQALSRLAHLVKYRLDGGYSENFNCFVLLKGKPMLAILRSLRSATLAVECEKEVEQAKAKSKGKFADLRTDGVCVTVGRIEERVRSLIRAIEAGTQCPLDDF